MEKQELLYPPKTLRDEFAMAALQGAWAANQLEGGTDSFRWPELAKRCYAAADEMMKARKE